MEYNIPVKNSIGPNLSALWVGCSIDTRRSISLFFTDILKFERKLTPLIIHGINPFTIHEYRGLDRSFSMIVI